MHMKYTGFLCGAFSVKGRFVPYGNWHSTGISETERVQSSNFYYPEFVDFNYGANKYSISRFTMDIGQEIPVEVGFGEGQHKVSTSAHSITLYQAPFGLMLFSIRIDLQCTGNDVTAVVSRLRSIDMVHKTNKPFADAVIAPLMEVYRKHSPSASQILDMDDDLCHSRLVEYGNKLKVFQIATIEAGEREGTDSDELLFELGTIAPIGSYDPENDFSPSKAYYDKIMGGNSVSVFNNWKALSLFDTFTFLGHDISEGNIENWIKNYFGMIYVSELFVKFYLFRLNNDFRISHQRADKLLEQFDEFEYSCWFDQVSYNFLPRLIHHSMEEGLEILPEKERLYQMIAQQKDKREKDDDQRMNNLLFYLTLFTTFSMVWDAGSLFNEMYPFETYLGSATEGFRLVSYTLLLAVLILIILTRFKKR